MLVFKNTASSVSCKSLPAVPPAVFWPFLTPRPLMPRLLGQNDVTVYFRHYLHA